MYIPKENYFENTNEIIHFVEENNFGILISRVNEKPWATHIPMVIRQNAEDNWILEGHISKANKQWQFFNETETVLAIFQGPNTYISASWYDHENASTWNYIAVHVYGKLKIHSEEETRKALIRLVDKHEKTSEHPISMETMSENFIKQEIKGIVSFEIEISNIEAIEKLSQNREKHNYDNVVKELEKRGDYNSKEIAERMKRKR